jgi:peroxiredoxin
MKVRQAIALIAALFCWFVAIALLVATGLPERTAFTSLRINETPSAPELGALAPNFNATTLNDEMVSLGTLRGTPLILNFWATWCEPCEVELPELQRIADEFTPQQLRVLAVNNGEADATIEAWIARLQLSLTIVLDRDLEIVTMYQVRGLPQTFILDGDGIVRDIFFGAVNYDTLYAAVRPYITSLP